MRSNENYENVAVVPAGYYLAFDEEQQLWESYHQSNPGRKVWGDDPQAVIEVIREEYECQ